jgi:hypothetical protein
MPIRIYKLKFNTAYSMNKKIGKFVTAAVILFTCSAAWSAVIYTGINRRELSVGDLVNFTVTIMAPKGATVQPPDPASAFDPLTVKEWNNRKIPLKSADSVVFEYQLTTYKAENCTIPQLPFILNAGNSSDTLKTDSIPLTVISLCKVDTADIMGLKPQQVTGKRSLLWLWICLGLLALIAAILFARSLIHVYRKGPPPPPPKPPYEEAIEALAALDAKQYPLKGMIREYVFELSEILKRYSERRFGVNAAEFTTEEMLAWLAVSGLEKEQRYAMEWFYRAADPVKFAKYLPDQGTVDRFGAEARAFVEATKPVVEVKKADGAQPSPASGEALPPEAANKTGRLAGPPEAANKTGQLPGGGEGT